ncbi:hypothetical protein JMJ77_0010735 [Colletotrichum scovillei]|uniref:Uncharacterized protein n=1 Tax=Colletotrichum scovillei TaxID=1209932 RepID=A0A9P7R2P7_9PEZI|nr:hypothetical protein JMJ77_0010735 [Colletotrichum scovillei]KAG7059699.1 hypothetical protein JMJ78_0014988 [Colletotrichum scovillei]KAG7067149.1 hypothetical protein JMJ76_0008592 [Colletotrichum scovillei]
MGTATGPFASGQQQYWTAKSSLASDSSRYQSCLVIPISAYPEAEFDNQVHGADKCQSRGNVLEAGA